MMQTRGEWAGDETIYIYIASTAEAQFRRQYGRRINAALGVQSAHKWFIVGVLNVFTFNSGCLCDMKVPFASVMPNDNKTLNGYFKITWGKSQTLV